MIPFLCFLFFFCSWVLLEVLDKIFPGSVNWKQATKPPIKMPFRKVENCNQVIKIGKQLKLSLVNVAGNDFVQGNKKLILGNMFNMPRYIHFCKYYLIYQLFEFEIPASIDFLLSLFNCPSIFFLFLVFSLS